MYLNIFEQHEARKARFNQAAAFIRTMIKKGRAPEYAAKRAHAGFGFDYADMLECATLFDETHCHNCWHQLAHRNDTYCDNCGDTDFIT